MGTIGGGFMIIAEKFVTFNIIEVLHPGGNKGIKCPDQGGAAFFVTNSFRFEDPCVRVGSVFHENDGCVGTDLPQLPYQRFGVILTPCVNTMSIERSVS